MKALPVPCRSNINNWHRKELESAVEELWVKSMNSDARKFGTSACTDIRCGTDTRRSARIYREIAESPYFHVRPFNDADQIQYRCRSWTSQSEDTPFVLPTIRRFPIVLPRIPVGTVCSIFVRERRRMVRINMPLRSVQDTASLGVSTSTSFGMKARKTLRATYGKAPQAP